MNYLGHAYLSFNHPGLLVGNMIGDHIKGRIALQSLPQGIHNGVLLHREIDRFADNHPASQKAKTYFREHYRLYAGAFVDSLYDHFIANDPHCFTSEQALFDFTQDTYRTLEQHLPQLPEGFQKIFPYMQQHNWLYNYRTMKGIQKSFNGLAHRAKYIDSADQAYVAFVSHYYTLNQYYYEFIDDVKPFVETLVEQYAEK